MKFEPIEFTFPFDLLFANKKVVTISLFIGIGTHTNKQHQNEIETKKESLKRELLSSQSTKGVKRPNPKGEMTQITN